MSATNLARAVATIAAIGACSLGASTAFAGVDVDRPGSLLIFPKVVSTADRDTVIQITNTGNMTNEVRCYYVNGTTCRSMDFSLNLTKQQPTQWTASSGRTVDPFDSFGSEGAGFDPGLIPSLPDNFEGALVCAEVVDGVPVAQNKLAGQATILDVTGTTGSANTSKYNAVAVTGGTGNSDNTLSLDDSEYAQCSTEHRIDFIPDVSPGVDPVIGADAQNVTNVTVLPCDLDIVRSGATDVILNATLWDEFESQTSGPDTTFSCWASFSIDPASLAPTNFATVEYSASSPVVMVVEAFHSDTASGATGATARSVHTTGGAADSEITLSSAP